MRRTQFTGGAKGKPAKDGRPSIRDLITCDLKRAFEPHEMALAEKRVAMFNHAPLLMAGAHMIWGTGLIVHCLQQYSVSQTVLPIIVLAALLLADGALGVLMRISASGNLATHHTTRGLCGGLAAIGLLWMLFIFLAHGEAHTDGDGIAIAALGAGLAASTMVALHSPAGTITNAAVVIGAAALFAGSPLLTGALALMAVAVVGYSIANARSMVRSARRRQALDEEARKALHFVHEFESSGRGWFWETSDLGTLSYVSHQLADDFHCSREELLGRQFTDLLSVDTSHGSGGEEHKTL